MSRSDFVISISLTREKLLSFSNLFFFYIFSKHKLCETNTYIEFKKIE